MDERYNYLSRPGADSILILQYLYYNWIKAVWLDDDPSHMTIFLPIRLHYFSVTTLKFVDDIDSRIFKVVDTAKSF